MERPTQATRRFYNAFYRWASLSYPPHSGPHIVRLRQTYRTSARLLDDGNSRKLDVARPRLKQGKDTGDAKERRRELASHQTTSQANEQRTEPVLQQAEQAAKSSRKRSILTDYTRAVLRPLTHPVVIITAGDRDENSPPLPYGCRGVTVSSFSSVSMAGDAPVVSFNLKIPSRTWDVLRNVSSLRVHLLRGTAEGAALAHAFTQPYEEPQEAFDAIQALGAKIIESPNKNAHGHKSVKISHPAVSACIHASILPKHTVTIDDHVVVFASVQRIEMMKDETAVDSVDKWEADSATGMLAYGLQGYRSLGSSIATLPELQSSMSKHEARPKESLGVVGVAAGNSNTTDSEPLQQSRPAKIVASSGIKAEMERRTAEIRETQNVETERASDETINTTINSKEPLPKNNKTRQSSSNAWGLPTSSRSFPALARASPLNQGRQYSTSPSKTKNAKSTHPSIDPSLDPKTTVQDFLCIPAAVHRPKRTRLLQLHAHDAEISERYLATYGDDLSTTDQEKLTARIARNRRFVTKKRALNAAEDLERFLNEGKVYARTAPWLEGSVEAGIVVVREEAAEAQMALDEGRLGKEVFDAVRKRLEGEHEFLSTQAQRLRDMMQEDEEDFGPGNGGSGRST
ncbi:Hypothetical protein R9X50_00011200 [Acrodontium crateriforme]|uniref:Flavin reductase like domain-containing protein n=1 Tax=Acrodontium crateriforme TaxID=150365 RepID=A0AAQ3LWP6_9PEZI|nr:Hypothetical protein R9X50_00011200 [Acrodontium crateriforme]